MATFIDMKGGASSAVIDGKTGKPLPGKTGYTLGQQESPAIGWGALHKLHEEKGNGPIG